MNEFQKRLRPRRLIFALLATACVSMSIGQMAAYACNQKCEMVGHWRCSIAPNYTGRWNCRTDGLSVCRFDYCI